MLPAAARRLVEQQLAVLEGHDRGDGSDLSGRCKLSFGFGVDLGVHHVGVFSDDSAKVGANARHGPHQEAQ